MLVTRASKICVELFRSWSTSTYECLVVFRSISVITQLYDRLLCLHLAGQLFFSSEWSSRGVNFTNVEKPIARITSVVYHNVTSSKMFSSGVPHLKRYAKEGLNIAVYDKQGERILFEKGSD